MEGFATISHSLKQLMVKGTQFERSDECDLALWEEADSPTSSQSEGRPLFA